MSIRVDIANEHSFPLDEKRLKKAVRAVLKDAKISRGEISIAIVNDKQMHELNRRHLNHDYPTDVLSFLLENDKGRVSGEIIASSDYAAREAKIYDWAAEDEILLYVIHGSLHLVGYDDLDPKSKKKMRTAEKYYLGQFGLTPTYDE